VTAVNCAAVAANESYQAIQNATLNVPAPGVRGNDTDVDSPAASLASVVVTQPVNGTVTLAAAGSFSFKPKNGFVGIVTFTYTVKNVAPSGVANVPMSADSNIATVTITVVKK
jgi:hypothetical protein